MNETTETVELIFWMIRMSTKILLTHYSAEPSSLSPFCQNATMIASSAGHGLNPGFSMAKLGHAGLRFKLSKDPVG